MQNKKIGLYISDGVTSNTINVWLTHYKNGLIKNMSVLKTGDFILEKLNLYDLIILPGGSGSKICNTLGEKGRNELKKYVELGGNLLGVCAGAYAVSSGYDWSLSMINYELVDKKNAHRGELNMSFNITKKGRKLLGINENTLESVYYHNGPVWKKFDVSKLNATKVLAIFNEDIYAPDGNKGEAQGTPAIIYEKFGSGKVIAISPHFEKSKGKKYIIKKIIQFLIKDKK